MFKNFIYQSNSSQISAVAKDVWELLRQSGYHLLLITQRVRKLIQDDISYKIIYFHCANVGRVFWVQLYWSYQYLLSLKKALSGDFRTILYSMTVPPFETSVCYTLLISQEILYFITLNLSNSYVEPRNNGIFGPS